jgi:hypothetical protein
MASFGIATVITAAQRETMDSGEMGEMLGWMLRQRAAGQGAVMAGPPRATWHMLTQADWDADVAILAARHPDLDDHDPGFSVGDWMVMIRAQVTMPGPVTGTATMVVPA